MVTDKTVSYKFDWGAPVKVIGIVPEKYLAVGKGSICGIGQIDAEAVALAHSLAALPQAARKSDRLSSYQQWSRNLDDALRNESQHGKATITTGEMIEGLDRYAAGAWGMTPPD